MMSNNTYTMTENKNILRNENRKVYDTNDSYYILHNNTFEHQSNINNNKLNDLNPVYYNKTNNDINSNFNAPLKYKKYNFHEISKELNNEQEQKNDISNFYGNNNNITNNKNLLRFNSYRDIHNNNNFHKNLNIDLEKNQLKLENERLIKENILIKKELNDALNQIGKIKEQNLSLNANKNK